MTVSVVVPTFRRIDYLRRCLEALFDQQFDGDFEILIADDGNDPAVEEMVREMNAVRQISRYSLPGRVWDASECGALQGAYPMILQTELVLATRAPQARYIAVNGAHGPAAARNRGWQAARGEIIAFTDDDCIPAPDWLQQGCDALCRTGADGVCGRVVVPLGPECTDYERDTTGLERAWFVTANSFYRRDALQMAGGFDERFTTAWREDSDLFFTLKEMDCLLLRAPDAVVVHPVRPAVPGISLRLQKKSRFNALLYKKHPVLYRQYIQKGPPMHYYAMLLTFLVGVAGVVLAVPELTLMGGVVWLALWLEFTLRRLRGTSHRFSHVWEMMYTSALIPFLSIYWRLRGAWQFRTWFF